MAEFVLTTVWILVFSLSAYGWGTMSAAASALSPAPWTLHMTLGLASWVFIGGILNLLHLAHPEALGLILVLGILFSVRVVIRRLGSPGAWAGDAVAAFLSWTTTERLAFAVVIMVLAASYCFLTLHLIPTEVFNPHDDLQVYFTRLTRMLQTGTVAASPFAPIGIDSLGGQAFLQTFLLAWLPFQYVNAFDAIVCFLLYALLLFQLGGRLGLSSWMIALAVVLFAAINPQYVNISSVYSGSLMVLGMAFAALQTDLGEPPTLPQVRRLLPLALFMAALLALKTTFVVFVAAFLVAYSAATMVLARNRRNASKQLLVLGLVTLAAIAPWAAAFAPEYADALHLFLGAPPDDAQASVMAGSTEPGLSLLSLSPYGGNLLQHHGLALLGALFAVSAIASLAQRPRPRCNRAQVVLFALCFGTPVAYAVNLLVFNPITAVRYSSPVLVGALPAALLLLLAAPRAESIGVARRGLLGLVLLMIVSFTPVLMLRLDTIGRHHTLVSFPVHEEHVEISAAALDDGAQASLARAQERTPPGSTIIAYTATPFHLDHARNTLLTVAEPGLLNPWLDLPVGSSAEVLRAHLQGLGVDYVLWDASRKGMKPDGMLEGYLRSPYEVYRRLGAYGLWLREGLDRLMAAGIVVYRDDRRVVFAPQRSDRPYARGR